jgi:energy-coupling factor transporter ATP-binding protein EcfA2
VTADLVRLEVRGLLGQFDHVVEFPKAWEFVILYGPNGVGKTKLLELISGVYDLSQTDIGRVPFSEGTLTFDDGSVVEVQNTNDHRRSASKRSARSPQVSGVSLTLRRKGARPVIWKPEYSADESHLLNRALEHEFGFHQVGPDLWFDPRHGDRVRTAEVVRRYPHLLDRYALPKGRVPDELREFFESTRVHMIKTHRLLTYDTLELRPGRLERDRHQPQVPTVVQFGQDLARRFKEALAANSLRTQQLDRTFPRRLLEPGGSKRGRPRTVVSEEQIRQKYVEQEELRARLASIAVLEESADVPLPNRQLEEWERLVLWMYLQDTDERLATFQDLLSRVDLFRDIVNSRFQFKELHFDPRQGFRFVTGSGLTVSAEDLSSGEQHELVLAYDLLFNVAHGSLVLIDEPEISLHVTWQQEFLNDLVRIARQSRLRFVVATHSPQIIHKWWSRAQALTADFAADGEEI